MAQAKGQSKNPEKKGEALQHALGQIEKQYGKGSIMRLGGTTKVDIPCIPTGALSLDIALGGRGIPRGRVIEIFGPEASGKTTLCMHIIANAQRLGGNAAFIDVEHAVDPTYTQRLGVNLDDLIISQPDSGEQALDTAELLVRSNAVDVVVVDSVAALVTKHELEGDMGDAHIGLQARLMSQALRKLTSAISKSQTCVIFTNQIRMKIGMFFGNPETTPGGRALKFYASVRLDIRRIGAIKNGDEVIGSRARVNVVKNKVAPPFKKAEFDILHSQGISKEGDLLDLGTHLDIVEKSGTWLDYKDHKLGQGKEKAREFLKTNPKVVTELEADIYKAVGLAPAAIPKE
ncbi:recombinase RecA [Planctomycetota bacterium]